MKRAFTLVVLMIFFAWGNMLFAQRKIQQIDPEAEEKKQQAETTESNNSKAWLDNFSYGGNVGAFFGSGGSLVALQPQLFYRITDNSIVGTGLSYYYWQQKYIDIFNKQVTVSDNAYGFNLFGRQQLFDPIFVHAEYMPMNFKVYQPLANDFKREWVSSFYVGGGLNTSISNRSGYYFVVLYDLLYNTQKSFRASPIDIRTGFYF